ncbi:hypothetical protein [Chitinophaga nivalis]|uniref:Uncharacterized protein n=1 Tax=Chitinophaga nivalis TaxID=2991709 RepID=A0ABT3IS93_9BACT|nr:hypothetical protein [Chitinophaga nivalis]MCW3463459.1 hypothetical protein [Chitinophaga nivalis]MCW3486851.1 hypothetical protein [Chitinophaga nivalis]
MKLSYYVSKITQMNGDHEVHDQNCNYLPTFDNRLYLGQFESCRDAVNDAKKYYSEADGCQFCSPDCNKR